MLEQRTWVYVQQPKKYGIALHPCGHPDPEWSEYKDFLWCPACKCEFVPEHWGLFDGPIGVNVCKMMGISFDRFNLLTNQVEPFEMPKRS